MSRCACSHGKKLFEIFNKQLALQQPEWADDKIALAVVELTAEKTNSSWRWENSGADAFAGLHHRLRNSHVHKLIGCLKCCEFLRYLRASAQPLGFAVGILDSDRIRDDAADIYRHAPSLRCCELVDGAADTAAYRVASSLQCRELVLRLDETFDRDRLLRLLAFEDRTHLRRLTLRVSSSRYVIIFENLYVLGLIA